MRLRFAGRLECEAYRIFHISKEEKRNNVGTDEWARAIGEDLVSKIKNAKQFELVEADIVALLDSKNARAMASANEYAVWASGIRQLWPASDSAFDEYVIKTVLIAPGGIQHLFLDSHNVALVPASLSKEEFIKTAEDNLFRVNFWGRQDVDYHALFHVFFYHWRAPQQHLNPQNFNNVLMAKYAECEQALLEARACQ